MPLTEKEKDEFVAYLAEGMHTSFRKGGQGESSDKIWRLIRDMPKEEWLSVMWFFYEGLINDFVDQKKVKKEFKNE